MKAYKIKVTRTQEAVATIPAESLEEAEAEARTMADDPDLEDCWGTVAVETGVVGESAPAHAVCTRCGGVVRADDTVVDPVIGTMCVECANEVVAYAEEISR